MESNPYAAPKAPITDTSYLNAGTTGQVAFFPVSRTKLLVLSICTFGLYDYYWMFMNWRIIRDTTGEQISPFWRTFFAVFFCYQLFDRVRKHSPGLESGNLAAGPLAAVWIILSLMWRLPGPWGMLTYGSMFALLPVQKAINEINASVAPDHDPNDKFTGWNWVAIVLGGAVVVLSVIGLTMPPA